MKAGAAVHTMHGAVDHEEDLSACCWILCQCTHLVLLPLFGLHHPRHGVIVALHRQQLQRLFLQLQLRLVLSDRLARSHRGAECCKKNVGYCCESVAVVAGDPKARRVTNHEQQFCATNSLVLRPKCPPCQGGHCESNVRVPLEMCAVMRSICKKLLQPGFEPGTF